MKNMKLPSNRSFGIVFFLFFFILAFWPLLSNSQILKIPLILSIIFLLLGVFNSKILKPFNKIWVKSGLLLGSIISPIVMGLVFFFVVTPIGMLVRILKKDVMGLKRGASSYWITREDKIQSMKKQF